MRPIETYSQEERLLGFAELLQLSNRVVGADSVRVGVVRRVHAFRDGRTIPARLCKSPTLPVLLQLVACTPSVTDELLLMKRVGVPFSP